jgi:hypothetical protein
MRGSTPKRGGLACAGELDRLFDRQIPGVVQIEIGDVAREQVGVGEAGVVRRRGVARDRERRATVSRSALREKSELLAWPRCWPM